MIITQNVQAAVKASSDIVQSFADIFLQVPEIISSRSPVSNGRSDCDNLLLREMSASRRVVRQGLSSRTQRHYLSICLSVCLSVVADVTVLTRLRSA